MGDLERAVEDFLSCRRIAVVGVSRQSTEAANHIYRKLRDAGHQVFAVNPQAQELEGDRCYPELAAIPETVEGVVVSTPPEAVERIVEQCGELGIRKVWMHRSFGTGSVSESAVRRAKELGLEVIPGACPMMYCEPVDIGHKCMRWLLRWTGGLPKP